jgi:hypothetical protein
MIDLIRLQTIEELHQTTRVRQITVMQKEPDPVDVRVLIQVVDSRCVEGAGPTDDPVHLIPFAKQKIREVGAVLSRDSSD